MFVDVSSQFTIPIAIAAVVRTGQRAPFFEITFLESLTSMQFAGFFAGVVAAGVTTERKTPIRIVVFVLYGLVNFGFYVGVIRYLYTSRSRFQDLEDLANACQGYGYLLPAIKLSPGISTETLSYVMDKLGWNNLKSSIGEILSIFSYLGLLLAAVLILLSTLFLARWLCRAFISKDARILGGMSFTFTIWALVELVEMEKKRNVMKSLSGAGFLDNEWGFGQVVSLCLWFPLVFQGFYYFVLEGILVEAPQSPLAEDVTLKTHASAENSTV
jgi:hypothetical protein